MRACETAVTADALQGSRPDQFGSTPLTEYSPITNTGTACGDLGRTTGKTIARQPNTATVNVFQSLLNIFKPDGSFTQQPVADAPNVDHAGAGSGLPQLPAEPRGVRVEGAGTAE